jgi:ATP-dependent protease ClpP protease subunit
MLRQKFHFSFLKVLFLFGFFTFVLLMKKATVYITGPIVAESSIEMCKMFGVYSLATVRADVEATPGATEVDVIINSPGGSYIEGFAIHDYLRSLNIKIHSKVIGMCASIATIPMLAGDTREMSANSEFVIHNPWLDPSAMSGMEADEIIKLGNEVKAAETKMLAFYVERTGADKAVIEALMKQDSKLSAERAKELGFVTDVTASVTTQAKSTYKILAFLKTDPSMSTKPKPTAAEAILAEFKNLMGDVKAAINGNKPAGAEVQAKTFATTTTDGDAVSIEAAGDQPAAGDVVTKDGQPFASKTFTVADGQDLAGYAIKTDAEGKVTEVTAPASAAETEETKALKAENAALKQALATVLADVKDMKAQIVSTHQPPAPTGGQGSRKKEEQADTDNPFKKAASNVAAKHRGGKVD